MAMSLHSEHERGLIVANIEQTCDGDARQASHENFSFHIQSLRSAEGWRWPFFRNTDLFQFCSAALAQFLFKLCRFKT